MTRIERAGITLIVYAAVLAGMLTFGASRASADLFTTDLTDGNSAISGFSGPYAVVTVDLESSTTALITFKSLSNDGNIYLMGDGGTVALNVNATGLIIPNVSLANGGTGFTPGPIDSVGPGTEDGFGTFNTVFDGFDGFTHSSDDISFVLVNLGGTWASAADVLTPNADGFDAAAHIFVTSFPANAANGALATGFAANGAPVTTPEPSSMAFIPFGLGALLLMRKRTGYSCPSSR